MKPQQKIFREFYGLNTFIEKSAIPAEYGFVSKSGKDKGGYSDFFRDKEWDYVIVVEAKGTDHGKAKSEVQFYISHIKPFEELKTQMIVAENSLHSNILDLLKR